jgi:apolipoprotein N-acyltransferase
MPTKKLAYSLAATSGLLLILCQPPVSFFFLAYVALVPVLFSLEAGGTGRDNFLLGFAAGIVCYAGLVYWVVVAMNTYGGISVPLSILTLLLLVLYMALYLGCFTWSVSFLRDRFHIPVYLTAAPLWVLLEYVRGFLLSGFPWSLLAHSQFNFLPILQVISITGTYFISFLIVTANCLIYEGIRRRRFPLAYGSVVVALIAVSLLFGVARLKEPIQGTLRASIVQGNVRQDVKFDEKYKNSIVHTYSSLTLEHAKGADLVIWPETAMPFVFLVDPASAVVRNIPVTLSNNLLVGAISRDEQKKYYNTAYVIGKQGELAGTYSKGHLVPFGEYTPLASYFPFLEHISVAAGDFFPGPSHDPITTGVGKIGVLICYEGIFPYITNQTVGAGAEVLVNITNDAWFGPTSAPYQHLAFYVFRAIETDRYVLRAANTGISAVIDPRGRTLAKTGIFKEAVLNGTFSLRRSKTIYVRYGDYFVLFALLYLCALIVLGRAFPDRALPLKS